MLFFNNQESQSSVDKVLAKAKAKANMDGKTPSKGEPPIYPVNHTDFDLKVALQNAAQTKLLNMVEQAKEDNEVAKKLATSFSNAVKALEEGKAKCESLALEVKTLQSQEATHVLSIAKDMESINKFEVFNLESFLKELELEGGETPSIEVE
jgi:hypothetical protein